MNSKLTKQKDFVYFDWTTPYEPPEFYIAEQQDGYKRWTGKKAEWSGLAYFRHFKQKLSYEPIISHLLTATMPGSVKNQSDTSSFEYKEHVSRPDKFAINHESQFLSG